MQVRNVGDIMVLDEITSNRLVSVVAISVLIITSLIVFSTSQVNLQAVCTRTGVIGALSGGTAVASVNELNCTYEISHDQYTNSTTIRGAVEEAFTASHESANLTFAMGISVVAMEDECSVDVYKKSTLTSELPVTIYESSDHYPPAHFAFEEHSMQGNCSFNNTSPQNYVLTMEWNITLTFTNISSFGARFSCNISFALATPSLVRVTIPSSLGYSALAAATVGVVIISIVVRAWNRPRLIDDSGM